MLWELNDGRQGSLRVGSRGGEPHTSPRDLAAGFRVQHTRCASIAATATAQLVLPASAVAASPAPLAALAQESQHVLVLAAAAAHSFLAAAGSGTASIAQRRRRGRPASHGQPAAGGATASANAVVVQQQARAAQQLLAGGVAGAVSKTLVAPLERISTLLMTPAGGQRLCLGGAAAHAWRDGGLGGLYRGHAATLLKIVPASAIQFAVYNGLKDRFLAATQRRQQQQQQCQAPPSAAPDQQRQRQQQGERRQRQAAQDPGLLPGAAPRQQQQCQALPAAAPDQQRQRQQQPELRNWERLAAGAAAGAASSLACYPLEALRTAMSVAGGVRGSLPQAARAVVAAHGVAALYRGFRASLLGDVLGNALGFTAYELGGKLYADMRGGAAPTPAARGAIGAASAAAVLTLTMPLEVARRRLQVQGLAGRPVLYHGTLDCLRHILRHEGLAGFYAASVPSYLKVAPSIGCMYFCFELMMSRMPALPPPAAAPDTTLS